MSNTRELLVRHMRNMQPGDEIMFCRNDKLSFARVRQIVIGDDPYFVTVDGERISHDEIREVYYPNAAFVR